MLNFTVKLGEPFIVGDSVIVLTERSGVDLVRVSVDAPKHIIIHREADPARLSPGELERITDIIQTLQRSGRI